MSTYTDIENTLKSMGYSVKNITKSRLSVVTDRRSEAISNIMKVFKGSRLSKSDKDLNISSLGVVYIGSIQVIAKPASLNVLRAEQEATEALVKLIRKAVEQEGRSIDISIGKYILRSVVAAGSDQIRGTPKADILLFDDRKNRVGFISHKKEGGAKAFQQYSGISKDSGKTIYEDDMVVKFFHDLHSTVLKETKTNSGKNGLAIWRGIPNNPEGRRLAARSVYGPDWTGGRSFGINSVHCVGQGIPILTRQFNGSYKLSFSEVMHTADEIDWIFRGDYQIIFASTYRSGRTTISPDYKILNMRSGIYPYRFIKARKAIEI
jgi:hypothetical protein